MPNRRKSAVEKKLTGTARKDRVGSKVLVVEILSEDTSPPAYFGDIAKNEWEKVIKSYRALKIFSVLDTPILAIYCKAVEDLQLMEQDIHDGNVELVSVSSKGDEYTHPSVGIRAKLIDTILKSSEKLGINPIARGRFGEVPQAEKDKFTEMFG